MVDLAVRTGGERGRPRSGTAQRPDLSSVEQILDAAAHLFVERGYAATSTRAIADQVGIRQASLYYHFSSKEQMLEALLMRTVEPSARAAHYLESAQAPAPVRLHALIAFDTEQLFTAPHNVGSLYLLPEVRNELFEPFRIERSRLRELYATLISASVAAPIRVELGPARAADAKASLGYLVDVVFGMVESAIAIRADRAEDDAVVLISTIAQSCMRVLGYDSAAIDAIGVHAEDLLVKMNTELWSAET